MNAIAPTPPLDPELVLDPVAAAADAKLRAEVEDLLARVTHTVENDEDYVKANADGDRIAAKIKEVEESWKPLVDQAHKTHKLLCDARASRTKPLKEVRALIDAAVAAYADEKERQRVEAERLAQAAAAKAEEDRIAREAAALEAAGEKELAQQVLEEHVTSAPVSVSVASTLPKMSGRGALVKTWDYEVVKADLLPRKYLVQNDKLIAAEVKALGAATKIPGVRVFQSTGVRRRA